MQFHGRRQNDAAVKGRLCPVPQVGSEPGELANLAAEEGAPAKSGLYIRPDGRVQYVHAEDVKRDALGAVKAKRRDGTAALGFARRRLPDGWEPLELESSGSHEGGAQGDALGLCYENVHTGERIDYVPREPASKVVGESPDLYNVAAPPPMPNAAAPKPDKPAKKRARSKGVPYEPGILECPTCRAKTDRACGTYLYADVHCAICLGIAKSPNVALPCGHALCTHHFVHMRGVMRPSEDRVEAKARRRGAAEERERKGKAAKAAKAAKKKAKAAAAEKKKAKEASKKKEDRRSGAASYLATFALDGVDDSDSDADDGGGGDFLASILRSAAPPVGTFFDKL